MCGIQSMSTNVIDFLGIVSADYETSEKKRECYVTNMTSKAKYHQEFTQTHLVHSFCTFADIGSVPILALILAPFQPLLVLTI